jgi:hypothetical protein
VDRVETIDRAIEDYDERIDDERPGSSPTARVCAATCSTSTNLVVSQ